MNKKLNFKHEWVSQLLGNTYIGILVVDKVRKNLFVNNRMCEMFGFSVDEILQTDARVFHINDETFLNFGKEAFEFVLKGEPVHIDYEFIRKDGTTFWAHISGDLIANEEEVLWTLVDITQRKELELEHYKQAQLIEQMQDGVATIDLNSICISWNRGAQRILGYTKDEMLGEAVEKLYLEDDLEERKRNMQRIQEEGFFVIERKFVAKDKSVIEVELTGSVLKDVDGNIIGIIGYFKDIGDRKKAQRELEELNYNLKQYMDVIDKIDIGIFVVDDDFNIRYMNNTMIKWFGDQTNKTCFSSVAGLNEACSYCKLGEVIHENKKVLYEPVTPNGQSFEIVATSIKNSDGTISKMEVIRNITDRKNVEHNLLAQKEELDYLAHHDALTGLPNRILFNDRLSQGIKKAKRNKKILGLLFIDLDHFKEINDSLGHDMGDEVLKEVTLRLQSVMREEDSLARLGGDEFTIVLEELATPQSAAIFARKILDVLSKPLVINTHTMYISSSIGISLYPDDSEDGKDLLKFADSAMYKAKEEGRSNFQFYAPEMTEIAFERVVMEVSLRQAIEKKEFVVYYQPQVDGKENKLVGMEALVRWRHPIMGIISPAKFIPLAESTGLIVDIDMIVMKEAMNQFKKWYQMGYNPGVLALNLTVKQLGKDDFVETLNQLMDEVGCNCTHIELEVTESQIMSNPELAIKTLNKISDLGIELAIDDFGTGYSSLAYLKKLPINKLKIDQSFVRDLPYDEEDIAIANAVIALSKSLKLHVIAEGVETLEQKDFLVNAGCRNIQGYYYSKPIPAEEIEDILKMGFKI